MTTNTDKETKKSGSSAPAPTGLRARLRLTIGAKLVGLIALLLIVSIASLVYISTKMFSDDNTALIQQMNSDTAGSLATRMRELFDNTTDKMRVLGTVLTDTTGAAAVAPGTLPGPAPASARVLNEFFSKDKDFMALYVHRANPATGKLESFTRAASPELATLGDADGEKTLSLLAADKDYSLERLSQGQVVFSSTRLPDGSPAVVIGIPFIANETGDKFTHTLSAVLRQTKFLKAVNESDTITSFMVDSKGRLLAHPDANRVASGESMAQLEVVKQMLEGKFNNGQTRYLDPLTGEARLGAFHLVGFGGLGIVSEVAEAKAFEAAQRVEHRSLMVAAFILFLAFLTGYLYSGTITWPIKQLVIAAHRISQGDFAINLKTKGRDEVATLSGAFNEMAKGLEERDKVKATFNKFHNKEITDKLLSGEVKLGGERKKATIFFSDVRGFTAMSETMEPEQVVEMLNEYMTRMVRIIREHHGVVDKYVGDAIMAIWGVPLTGEHDSLSAVRACIEMRKELAALNELRLSRGQSALRIGMGLNTGQVIAGNIGSDEKMEYTVIGDSVNLASRMESMTKEYGTDFLIPRSIQDEVKDYFVFEQCKSAKVKGKTNAIEVFKVRGVIVDGKEVIVETPYSSYESEKSDKGVHEPEPEHAEEAPAATPAPVATLAPAVAMPAVAMQISDGPTSPGLARPVTKTNIPRPAPAEEAGWFVKLGSEALGPFSNQEISGGLAKGEFSGDTQICATAHGPWQALRIHAVFAAAVTPALAATPVAVAMPATVPAAKPAATAMPLGMPEPTLVQTPSPMATMPDPTKSTIAPEAEPEFVIQPLEIMDVTKKSA